MPTSTPPVCLVDTLDGLQQMLRAISARPSPASPLFLDFEGPELGRDGRIALCQVYFHGAEFVYLVDFIVLPDGWLDDTAADGLQDGSSSAPLSFRTLLESPDHPKLAFDPRNDADALFAHRIVPRNILCLQLIEVARRRSIQGLNVPFVVGLKTAFDRYLPHLAHLGPLKEAGVGLFAPDKGGSLSAWIDRPLHPTLINYAALDVLYFGDLMAKLWTPLSERDKAWVVEWSDKRCRTGGDPGYVPRSKEKAHAPPPPYRK